MKLSYHHRKLYKNKRIWNVASHFKKELQVCHMDQVIEAGKCGSDCGCCFFFFFFFFAHFLPLLLLGHLVFFFLVHWKYDTPIAFAGSQEPSPATGSWKTWIWSFWSTPKCASISTQAIASRTIGLLLCCKLVGNLCYARLIQNYIY